MHKRMRRTLIILLWLAVWQIAALWIDNHILLVGPIRVLQSFVSNVTAPGFLITILYSLARIGLGFFLALFAGLLFGAVNCRFTILEELLAPVIQTLKSIPVASFVVLLLIWFGSGRLSFFISFLIVFPNVYVNTIAGLKSADAKLLEMAEVFGMGRWNRFFYIYRPALMPYLISCLKISLGMSWKSGVAAEVIGLPDHSLGERLYMSKIYLDTAGLFAWTLTIVLVSFLFEKAVLFLINLIGECRPYPKLYGMRDTTRKSREICIAERDAVENNKSGVTGDGGQRATIEVSHIEKSYGTLSVLRDFSLSMEAGQHYILMAPSGTGKTTLLKILTGLETMDRGEIAGMPEHIGMVFQEDRLCEEYDAVCNIMLGMNGRAGERLESEMLDRSGHRRRRRDAITAWIRQEALQVLPEVCLTKPVSELSGGMRRRVALLRAVLADGEILILDEPFAGLDEENRIRCAAYILDRLCGRTLLVTTHRAEDVQLLRGVKVTL